MKRKCSSTAPVRNSKHLRKKIPSHRVLTIACSSLSQELSDTTFWVLEDPYTKAPHTRCTPQPCGAAVFLIQAPSCVCFFLLAKLLSVRCAPVSERAKACKKQRETRNETKNKPKTPKQTNQKKTQTPNTKKKQNTTNDKSLCSR